MAHWLTSFWMPMVFIFRAMAANLSDLSFRIEEEENACLVLANETDLGPVPNELKELTVIQEAMIARCRSKWWIIQLKKENQDLVL
jgi:hypothetical protein